MQNEPQADSAATTPTSSFYAHISRLRHIRRWGLMRCSVEEDVAQHSWEVAILAHALATIAKEVFGHEIDPHRVATKALFHDATEAITGDLPTPVKHSSFLKAATANMEREVSRELISLLPTPMQAAMAHLIDHEKVPPDEARIIKTADWLSAWFKCRQELRNGNQEFLHAEAQILAKLQQNMSPELEYFLSTFAKPFDLSLDQLMQSS